MCAAFFIMILSLVGYFKAVEELQGRCDRSSLRPLTVIMPRL